ncbi:heterokaryon incompatibility protein-domain-containing protein [Boeremia exigua]|uniref:heterokaryon incompatibility protein-domain-containing protein n=1 Tax=Boeremia exigua TaxID=749465 RepID=UPI001E8DC44B|nr:heterokaryon incompatibility protein-domain-containing protein [Boeremia exigua]KAH6643243.1 heterokaryon incompatibility protein-domain-containing protein [Boeremia exigua]
MSSWVKDCVQYHPQCARGSAESLPPTRLLDLEAFEQSNDLQLVTFDTKNVTAKYVALSHCWGQASQRPLTTTTGNIAQHLQRIHFFDLPLTFKDAVEVTRRLGLRYLWIDSLCIVQGDAKEWALEVSKMASVYGNALVTLCALSSVDSKSGCRVSNRQATTQDHRFFDFDAGPYRIRIFEQGIRKWYEEYGDNPYRHREYGNNPLRTRAWTLQERELSTRNIHFSENLVLWECKTLKASSEMPWDNLKPMDDIQPWPVKISIDESVSCDGPLWVRDRWYELMEDYMSRNLTNEHDKLPALSGLAQDFQRKIPSNRYLAGLWFDHLPRALLWRTGPNAHRPTSWRAPSWSFLSVDGNMSYESQRVANCGGSGPEQVLDDYRPTGLRVLDCDTHFTSTDIYGAMSGAELLLRGRIMQLEVKHQCTKDCEDHRTSADPWHELETTSGSIAGVIHFDVSDESAGCHQIWCLPVCCDPAYSVVINPLEKRSTGDIGQGGATVMGLALQKIGEMSNVFQRVGIFRWTEESLFDGITVSDLRLI